MSIHYDSGVPYDTPYYTYDGDYIGPVPVVPVQLEDLWPRAMRPPLVAGHVIYRPPHF